MLIGPILITSRVIVGAGSVRGATVVALVILLNERTGGIAETLPDYIESRDEHSPTTWSFAETCGIAS